MDKQTSCVQPLSDNLPGDSSFQNIRFEPGTAPATASMTPGLSYPKTQHNRVQRYNHQAHYDCRTVHSIVTACMVHHVSFVVDGYPVNLPMIGRLASYSNPSADLDEPQDLYIHGYVSSRIMNSARQSSEDGAMRVCVCCSKVDGLVLSLTPNTHNYNYRSAVLHGRAYLVTDADEKLWAMEKVTDSVLPGRWQQSRTPPDSAELQSTQILRIEIDSASAKVREGVPNDEPKDTTRQDILDRVWTGVVPVYEMLGSPIPGPYNEVSSVPEYITEYAKTRSEETKRNALAAARKPAPVKREKKEDEG